MSDGSLSINGAALLGVEQETAVAKSATTQLEALRKATRTTEVSRSVPARSS